MSDRDRSLQADVDPNDPGKVQRAFREMATLVSPTPDVVIDAAAEAANTRRFSIKVTDKIGQRWKGRWLMVVYISTTADADPSSTGNTVAFVGGTFVIATLVAGAAYLVLASVDGIVQMDLTIAGAATRRVSGLVLGKVNESDPFTWT